MSTEIRMPQMGESIAEATVTRWLKKPGDAVKRDEILFEISTDKVDTEVPAPSDGVLEEILVEEGATVEVNEIVARLGDGSGAAAPAEAPKAEEAPAPAPAKEQPKPEPQPEPAAAAPAATAEAPARQASSASSSPSTKSDRGKVRSSPLVRKIAREHGVDDLSAVPGTGVEGRVTKQDILNFVENGGAQAAPAAAPARAPQPAAVHGGHGEVLPVLGLPRDNARVESLTTMRKKIAEHMIDSKRTSAHVHSVFEADMTNVVRIREKEKKAFEERHGVKLTYMSFFIKAVCDAIKDFPWINASLDGEDIVIHQSVNMGLAVALEGGLIVPVIRNADELNLVGLQRRTTDLATRSRSKALKPDEVTGGTFTITNPGQFGGLFGIPIINQPQVAILGLGGIQKRPMVTDDGAIAVRDMVYMCIGYDHRLVDGAYADQFMAKVKSILENWSGSAL